jgi:RNA polymerase sigma factor (sigma-70 family)
VTRSEFESLYEHWRPRMMQYICWKVRGDWDGRVEDAVQDLFRYLWMRHEALDNSERTVHYLRRSALRAAWHVIRERQDDRCLIRERHSDEHQASTNYATKFAFEDRDIDDTSTHLLSTLPLDERRAVQLHAIEGAPLKCISQELAMSEDSAKHRLIRGLARLRHALEAAS